MQNFLLVTLCLTSPLLPYRKKIPLKATSDRSASFAAD
ncbi:hypothetical protein AVDCRST_MAG94-2538 [uncultured Leptolyngbya sp.]|uniref:Uncharacterized protein n=1 Tax=uncultured Leptolyngbya sp. TaxID=332963 RepID=A0A6J4M4Q8_9CYAN|nr:hypothetical protein AVDCRST_MAG94-2538 [uncultured Leptolyngbya sp.]